MAQYTKGPWVIRWLPDQSDCFVEAPKSDSMPYALDVCGDDYTGYGDEEQRIINMHLIAAAPDMHQAIESAIALVNEFYTATNTNAMSRKANQRLKTEIKTLLSNSIKGVI